MTPLVSQSPAEFARYLREQGIYRFFLIYDHEKHRVQPSHPLLEPIAKRLEEDERDFAKHEGIFIQVSQHFNSLLGAFVHRSERGQAQGGTRFWVYDTFESFLKDGVRLSKGMTRKNALAGLWWGGGKGVMSQDPEVNAQDPKIRAQIFQEFGEFVTSLQGAYVTAEDVGTTTEDMANIFSRTRFTTCIPKELGGSGNPSGPTSLGVVRGMEAALNLLEDTHLAGKKIVVQGLGHVAEPLIEKLFEQNVGEVLASDIQKERVEKLNQRFAGQAFEAVCADRGDPRILFEPCDVLAPCATGAVLNPETIPRIQASVICGAANNQLEDSQRDAWALQKRGIAYVPDFLVNRMGIVNCSNEQYGYVQDDPFISRHLDKNWELSIYQMTQKVLAEARERDLTPVDMAIQRADELAGEKHPIFGHRGYSIIQSLKRGNWAS